MDLPWYLNSYLTLACASLGLLNMLRGIWVLKSFPQTEVEHLFSELNSQASKELDCGTIIFWTYRSKIKTLFLWQLSSIISSFLQWRLVEIVCVASTFENRLRGQILDTHFSNVIPHFYLIRGSMYDHDSRNQNDTTKKIEWIFT